ncbi:MAG TPA: STAS domain-containing protein [Polyangiaceae bacterium]|nr:STAS domain-containing protein [Polyangiaceae bacterium]
MPNGHVTHAERNGIHVLRYFGKVDYMAAPAIQRFLDDLLEHERVSGLVFDLTSAEGLDSTNLGLLARVNDRVHDAAGAGSMIVSRSEDINDVLRSMGLDRIFEIVTDEPAPLHDCCAKESIDVDRPPSESELRHTMLEAHRALVDLSDAGREQFHDVVACLEKSQG